MWTVYKHTFPNGKVYIGITCQAVHRRWGRQGTGYRKQPIVYAAIEKYGWDNIHHEIILTDLTASEAKVAEQALIKECNSLLHANGYNGTPGGDAKGPASEETKRKMSEAQKGRKLSEEHRRKIGLANQGRLQSEEVKQKKKDSRSWYKHSAETKRKMQEAQANPVCQYTKLGQFVAEYVSAREAERQTGINHIGRCCNGKLNSAGGYIWRRKQEVM